MTKSVFFTMVACGVFCTAVSPAAAANEDSTMIALAEEVEAIRTLLRQRRGVSREGASSPGVLPDVRRNQHDGLPAGTRGLFRANAPGDRGLQRRGRQPSGAPHSHLAAVADWGCDREARSRAYASVQLVYQLGALGYPRRHPDRPLGVHADGRGQEPQPAAAARVAPRSESPRAVGVLPPGVRLARGAPRPGTRSAVPASKPLALAGAPVASLMTLDIALRSPRTSKQWSDHAGP